MGAIRRPGVGFLVLANGGNNHVLNAHSKARGYK